MKNSNPYYNVTGIDSLETFIDREDLLIMTLNNLFNSNKPQCRSIIGQRKIGKTSFLWYLQQEKAMKEIMAYSNTLYDRALYVYMDCQTHFEYLRSGDEFFGAMIKRLDESTQASLKLSIKKTNDLSKYQTNSELWNSMIECLGYNRIRVVYLFDEFGLAIQSQKLHQDGFFLRLRGYYQELKNFAWITSTHEPIQSLFTRARKEFHNENAVHFESNFYDGPADHLGLFDEQAVLTLIREPSSAGGISFFDDEIQAIIKFGGRFPYFLQMACNHFFIAKSRTNEKIDVNFILEQCRRDAYPTWDVFWDLIDDRSKQILVDVSLGEVTNANSIEIEYLYQQALVYKDSERKLHPFSEEFGLYILTKYQKPKPIFNVGEWVDSGRYQIEEIKSRNPNTEVVKVYDGRLKRYKAVKFARLGPDEESYKWFQDLLLREANILIELSHPYIGKVFDIVQEPLGLVMEWIDGISLEDLNKTKSEISFREFAHIGYCLADALTYLHNHPDNIIHRDIKPANIIITKDGNPKLIDFGIAHNNNEFTLSRIKDNKVIFQPYSYDYCSPEQIIPAKVGSPTDVFSLGIVLYEMLTKQLPFRSGNHSTPYGTNYPKPQKFTIPDKSNVILYDRFYDVLCNMLRERPEDRITAFELRGQIHEIREML